MRFALFILLTSSAFSARAGERAIVVLKAFVPPTMNTKIVQTQLSSSASLVTFSSVINSKYIREQQKFEILGLNQEGLEGQIKLIAGNSRTIQYELLIKHLRATMPAYKPIFLKITAN